MISVRGQILLLAATTFVAGANEYVLAGILDLVSRGLGASVETAGQLITVYALTYGLCVPIVIALTSRVGRRRVLVVAMALYAVASGASYFIDDFWMFAGLRVAQALTGGVAVVTALSTAATVAGPARQGRAIATVIMGFTASLIIAVPLGREMALRFGWNSVFLVIGVLGLLTVAAQQLVLDKLGPAAAIPLRQQLGMLKRPSTLAGLLVTVLWMAGYVITYSYLTPYLITVQHLDPSVIGAILLLFGVASLVGSRWGGAHTDRHGHHRTLSIAKYAQIASLVLLACVPLVFSSASVGIITGVLILWSVAAWACGPSQQVRVASLDAKASGVLVGLNQSGMQIGIAAGSALGGLVAAVSGLAALPWLSAFVVAIALWLMLVLQGRNKDSPATRQSTNAN